MKQIEINCTLTPFQKPHDNKEHKDKKEHDNKDF